MHIYDTLSTFKDEAAGASWHPQKKSSYMQFVEKIHLLGAKPRWLLTTRSVDPLKCYWISYVYLDGLKGTLCHNNNGFCGFFESCPKIYKNVPTKLSYSLNWRGISCPKRFEHRMKSESRVMNIIQGFLDNEWENAKWWQCHPRSMFYSILDPFTSLVTLSHRDEDFYSSYIQVRSLCGKYICMWCLLCAIAIHWFDPINISPSLKKDG